MCYAKPWLCIMALLSWHVLLQQPNPQNAAVKLHHLSLDLVGSCRQQLLHLKLSARFWGPSL